MNTQTKFKVDDKVLVTHPSVVEKKLTGIIESVGAHGDDGGATYKVILGDEKVPFWYLEQYLEPVTEVETFPVTEEPSTDETVPGQAFLTQTMPHMDRAFTLEDSGKYTVQRSALDPSHTGGDTKLVEAWLAEGLMGKRSTAYGANLPETVGAMTWDFIRLMVKERKLIPLFDALNEQMNEYADNAGLCSQYDEAVEDLNNIIRALMPELGFMFKGRSKQYRCVVSRTRTIQESMTVYVEAPPNATSSDLVDQAIDDAQFSSDSEWDVDDDNVDTTDYELIEYDIAD